jgi:uncharacterized protein with NRDE domain
MCLVLVAWRAHPDYPLVVAANRDEFFARPTAAASFWPGGDILAGRDLKEGGTWMGCARGPAGFRFAALTNYRDAARKTDGKATRGRLVADFLSDTQVPTDYLAALARHVNEYNDFNLMVGDSVSLACLESVTGAIHGLEPGIHGLSNHLLNTPWPKVNAAKSTLSMALSALPDDRPLFDLLRDDAIHPDDTLPRTGVSLGWERLLSSAFVKAPGYGTRSSAVLKVSRDGTLTFDEQTWLEGGHAGGRVRFRH